VHSAEGDVCVDALCDDSLLVLGGIIDVEELAGAQSEDHGLVVFLQLVVNFGKHEGGEVAVAEALIFEKGFSANGLLVLYFARDSIWPLGSCVWIIAGDQVPAQRHFQVRN
jgi:hypothetical protein